MTRFTPAEIWKQPVVLLGIHAGRPNTKISAFGCQSEDRFIFILMKTNHPVHIIVSGVVTCDRDVLLSFIYPHGLALSKKAYIKCQEEVVLSLIEGWMCQLEDRSDVWQHATQTEKPSLSCLKISVTTSPLKSVHLTPQLVIFLIIMYGAPLSESLVKLRTTPKMNRR